MVRFEGDWGNGESERESEESSEVSERGGERVKGKRV